MEVIMDIKVQSIKFNADQKLLDYIDKKVGKISKFFDGIIRAEVNLSLLADPQNKNVQIKAVIPGDDIVVERHADTFEAAVVDCVDVLKEQLTAAKEKRNKK